MAEKDEEDAEQETYHTNNICYCMEPIKGKPHAFLDEARDSLRIDISFNKKIQWQIWRMFKNLDTMEFTVRLKCEKCGREYIINSKLAENKSIMAVKNKK